MGDPLLRSPDILHLGEKDHCLIDVSSINEGTPRPYPTECSDPTLGWNDPHNARLPSSSCAPEEVEQKLQQLTEPQEAIEDVTVSIETVKPQHYLKEIINSYQSKELLFDYLHELFNKNLDPIRAGYYLRDTLPRMAQLALRLPELITQVGQNHLARIYPFPANSSSPYGLVRFRHFEPGTSGVSPGECLLLHFPRSLFQPRMEEDLFQF